MPDQLSDTSHRSPHGRRFRLCEERPALMAARADDLFEYEVECEAKERFWRE
jgi:hypothetical protein